MSSPSSLQPAPPEWKAGALSLYLRLLPAPVLDRFRHQAKLRLNNRVYTLAVVLWLMLCQWLQGHAPLDQAVLELLRGLPPSFWPKPCKRLQACRYKTGRLIRQHRGL